MKKKQHIIEVAPCLFNLNGQAPSEIKLTPAGNFKAKDGRPKSVSSWWIDASNAQAVIAAAAAQADHLLIDYEHQTLYSRENGQPAPAAGWFKTLEWRPNDGLYATDVEWTDAAKAAIESREYRYISPVMAFNKQTGEIRSILMAGLVNHAAIDGLNDLAAAHFHFINPEDPTVDKALLALLGLDESATDEDISGAITALKQKADQVDDLTQQVSALKSEPNTPDPAKFVPVTTMTALQEQVAALSTQLNTRERDELIETGIQDGKLLEAQRGWAETMDTEALKAFLETAPAIAALKGTQTGGKAPEAEREDGLTTEEVAMCKSMGIDEQDFLKAKQEQD